MKVYIKIRVNPLLRLLFGGEGGGGKTSQERQPKQFRRKNVGQAWKKFPAYSWSG